MIQNIDYDKLDWPQFGPDTRQEDFCKFAQNIRKCVEGKIEVANISQGFFASSVDIGWLQKRIQEVVKTLPRGSLDFNVLEEITTQVLQRATQRLTELNFKKLCEHRTLVSFVTRDDSGFYSYEFVLSIESLTSIKEGTFKKKDALKGKDILKEIAKYIEDTIRKDSFFRVTHIEKIYDQNGVELYQVDLSHKEFCKECNSDEDVKDSIITWRLKAWENLVETIPCGNATTGIRDLTVRNILGWSDPIPLEAITDPWCNISRQIDADQPNNVLLDEVIDLLANSGFVIHGELLRQIQDMLNKGSETFRFDLTEQDNIEQEMDNGLEDNHDTFDTNQETDKN